MRILFTDKHFEGEMDVERAASGAAAVFDVFGDGPDVTDEAWGAAEAILTSRCTPLVTAKIELMANCRIIVRNGVGFDGLDLEAFGARGIAVCNVPDYGTTEVADSAIAGMLALRRGIVSYHDGLRADPRANWNYRIAPCVDRLRGRRFGVVGLGRIGTAAARRAKAFDMEVWFYDPHLPDGADLATGFQRAGSLEALLAGSDVVTLHTPLNAATERMINAETLAQMKPDAVLINTARGPVVDIDAVYQALKAGRIGGVVLDVLPDEPPGDHPLIKAYTGGEKWLDGRLILTPHAAFFSPPGQRDLRRKGIETILTYFENGEARNCVNAGYLRRTQEKE